MSTFIQFDGYGVNATPVYVNASMVKTFWSINYNGLHGTEIELTDGSSIRVHAWPEDVKKALEENGS